MKKLLFVMVTVLLSTQSFASTSCDESALELAKNGLDQKAKAYGHGSSDIERESLKLIKENVKTGNLTYKVDGHIYKGSYTVTVTVDSLCGLESLKIKEDI